MMLFVGREKVSESTSWFKPQLRAYVTFLNKKRKKCKLMKEEEETRGIDSGLGNLSTNTHPIEFASSKFFLLSHVRLYYGDRLKIA